MTDRRPGGGRYSHLEREQRWVASQVPAGATVAAEIVDRYISGTSLRLRKVQTGSGAIYKLAQKVRLTPGDPEAVRLTNLYLTAEEHEVVSGLPSSELRKTRWHFPWNDKVAAIDEFKGRLGGLLLAEVELADGESPLPAPPFALLDVTNDDRFSGGSLACASDEEIHLRLREVDALRRD